MIWLGRLLVVLLLSLVGLDVSYLQAQTVSRTASWQDNSSNETSFVIQSCPGICLATSTLWKTIGTVPADVTTFLVGNMPVPSTTSYRIGALNSAGASPWSTIVVDDLPSPTTIPPAPTTFILPPCKSLTEILPTTTPKRYLCNP